MDGKEGWAQRGRREKRGGRGERILIVTFIDPLENNSLSIYYV